MASKTTLNAKNLETLGAERLAELLVEISTGSAMAKRRLRLELAGAQSPKEAGREVAKRLTSTQSLCLFDPVSDGPVRGPAGRKPDLDGTVWMNRLTDTQMTARNRRNLWIALALVAFIVMIFSTTFLRMQQNAERARDANLARSAAIAASAVPSGAQP